MICFGSRLPLSIYTELLKVSCIIRDKLPTLLFCYSTQLSAVSSLGTFTLLVVLPCCRE